MKLGSEEQASNAIKEFHEQVCLPPPNLLFSRAPHLDAAQGERQRHRDTHTHTLTLTLTHTHTLTLTLTLTLTMLVSGALSAREGAGADAGVPPQATRGSRQEIRRRSQAPSKGAHIHSGLHT